MKGWSAIGAFGKVKVGQPLAVQPPAGDDDGTLGAADQCERSLHILRRHARCGLGAGLGGDRVAIAIEQVLRQDQRHRAGCAGLGDVEGAGGILRNVFRVDDLDHGLGGVGEGLGIIHLLQGQTVQLVPFGLADQEDHRLGIVVGDVQGDGGVHRARPAADEANARLTAHPRVRDRHEAGPALVPADHQLDLRPVAQRVGEGQEALTRHAIDAVDAVIGEGIGEDGGDGLGHGVSLREVLIGS